VLVLIFSDPTIKDMFAHNAMQLAEENGHTKVVNYFKKEAKKAGCIVS
jgi:hypothetical protein